MTTATLIKKLNKEVETLRKDVRDIKKALSLSASVARDPEGEYRPAFVRDVKRALKEKSLHTFKDKRSFLKQVEKA